ncbi:MAG TPA: 23S rRNA (uracil(1939)-C(5))-methyltransferase RlmD [Spirochaetota bacterium]|nr:23S rRNA (uracil(1939)-C(5))-methyltransferase RlmD [Spirochaetota bacterium]
MGSAKKKKLKFLSFAEQYNDRKTSPRCPHFGTCGGCLFQDYEYDAQLCIKLDYLQSIFNGLCTLESIVPSQPFCYRNRMDFVTAFGKAGLRRSGSYRHVVDLETCEIMQEKSNILFKKLRPALLEIEGYNYLNHSGFLRYAVLRQGKFTGTTMVNFVIAHHEYEQRLLPAIETIQDDVDSISILFNDGLADMSFGEVHEIIKGGHIEESFDGIRFRITPNSFFQSNSEIALAMYRRVRDELQGEKVLDLYSGVGSISLFVAGKAAHVTGIELVEEAVDNARINMELNGITNVEFHCFDARDYLKNCTEQYDAVILDPPRAGTHPKVMQHLKNLGPETIIYISCNPSSFKNDLQELDNYAMTSFEAFDMFPQTPHIETLAVLKRK